MSNFATASGKDISTYTDPKSALVRIKFVQGGELPERLQGLFTSEREADQAITYYLEASKKPAKQTKAD